MSSLMGTKKLSGNKHSWLGLTGLDDRVDVHVALLEGKGGDKETRQQ